MWAASLELLSMLRQALYDGHDSSEVKDAKAGWKRSGPKLIQACKGSFAWALSDEFRKFEGYTSSDVKETSEIIYMRLWHLHILQPILGAQAQHE